MSRQDRKAPEGGHARFAVILALLSFVSVAFAIGCEGALGLGSYSVGLGDSGSGVMDSGVVDSTIPPSDGGMDSSIDSSMVKDSAAADSRTDGHVMDTGSVTDTGSADASEDTCSGEGGCYACSPTTTTEFLNACTQSACIPFDDPARIPGFDGGLPPLTPPDSGTADTGSGLDSGTVDSSSPSDASVADTAPPPPPACPSTNTVYVTGSSAALPLLTGLAQQLAALQPPISVIYQKPGSCEGVNDILDGTSIAGQAAIGWSSITDPGTACTIPSPEGGSVLVDIGVSDVFPQSCEPLVNGLPPGVSDFPGPIQTETFIVPTASSQFSISASAAYLVWGFGVQSGVAPWNVSNSQLFRRNSNSGTQVMISEGIGVLPVTDWRGIDTGSAQNLVADVAGTTSSTLANQSIGILALTDLNESFALQVRVLAYKHYDQECGFTPSTTATSKDLANVRNGHYALWGPLHLLTRVDSNNIPLNPNAKSLIDYIDGAEPPPGDLDLIQLEALNNVIPPCAMSVSRTSEIGPISPFAPTNACDCYYVFEATGQTTCQSCSVSSTCPASAPVCSFGYCEPQ